jgi:two-component system chemotaxis response regulator CheY
MSKTVLVIDDSMFMRKKIKDALTKEGYNILGEAATGESAIEMALNLKPELITLDNILPDMRGADILDSLNAEGFKPIVVVVSAVSQQEEKDKVKALGAVDYLCKPFENDELIQVVNKACA